MQTEMDIAKFRHYLQYPELILHSGKWEAIAVCLNCKAECNPLEPCFNRIGAWNHHCPSCGKIKGERTTPIPHEIWRRRFHTLKETRTWYGKMTRQGFWEHEKVVRNV